MIKFLLDAAGEVGQAEQTQSMLMSLGVMALFFVVFYFFLLRPQRKKEKELKEQIGKMSIGDKIITIGGITGTLANITDDDVTIYSSVANTPITFQKAAIQTIIPRNSEKNDKKSSKSEKPKKEKKDKKDEE